MEFQKYFETKEQAIDYAQEQMKNNRTEASRFYRRRNVKKGKRGWFWALMPKVLWSKKYPQA